MKINNIKGFLAVKILIYAARYELDISVSDWIYFHRSLIHNLIPISMSILAVLGFHAMLNQDQYNASLTDKPVHGGFKGIAKATLPMVSEPVAPNTTDVEKCIERLSSNDSSLTEINLNNIKVMLACARMKT